MIIKEKMKEIRELMKRKEFKQANNLIEILEAEYEYQGWGEHEIYISTKQHNQIMNWMKIIRANSGSL